jgi:hypothetical protein
MDHSSGIFASRARPCTARTRLFRLTNTQNGSLCVCIHVHIKAMWRFDYFCYIKSLKFMGKPYIFMMSPKKKIYASTDGFESRKGFDEN